MTFVRRATARSDDVRPYPSPENRAALNRHIAARIRQLSQRTDLGSQDLAATSISPELFAYYESGSVRVTPVHLLELANLFRVQIAYFFNSDFSDQTQ